MTNSSIPPETPSGPVMGYNSAGRTPAPTPAENARNILSTLAVLLIAPLVALLLTAFVFQSYQVDGPSMEATLSNNDRLIVWKAPRTWSRITRHAYIPQRGDVIVFVAHGMGDFESPDKQLIKRVVALPGERVVIKKGSLTVYNQEHPNGFNPDTSLPYGRVVGDTQGEVDQVIPKDSVFVAGDNRDNSLDSREFGPVASKDIVGKLVMRVLPLDQAKLF